MKNFLQNAYNLMYSQIEIKSVSFIVPVNIRKVDEHYEYSLCLVVYSCEEDDFVSSEILEEPYVDKGGDFVLDYDDFPVFHAKLWDCSYIANYIHQ